MPDSSSGTTKCCSFPWCSTARLRLLGRRWHARNRRLPDTPRPERSRRSLAGGRRPGAYLELVAPRAPHLRRALRLFCLAGFSLLSQDVERGEPLPFALEEHGNSKGKASLYEYRPLVRSYLHARTQRLAALADAQIALEELAREPAAAVYAAAHAGRRGDPALLRTILLPLLTDVAEACGGFDWDDIVFERAYEAFERTLLGIRPVLPIAATVPAGEPTRLDAFRAQLASDLLARLGGSEEDPELAEALDRWELSLFAQEPFRSEQLREALTALLGGPDGIWAATVRAAVLLGETGRDRAGELERLRSLTHGDEAGRAAA